MTKLLISILAFTLAGCVTVETNDGAGSRTRRPNIPDARPDIPSRATGDLSPTDPCAERLHALCGPLLMYYKIHRKLPARLEDLQDIAGPDPDVEFTCPVSGKPYVYYPNGLPRPDKSGFVLISDAEPTHAGMRWAVAAEKPRNTVEPLITKVVVEPETFFKSHAPEE